MQGRKIATQLVHAGFVKKDVHGSLQVPIYANAAFEFDTAEDIELAFQGKKAAHVYSRSTNPTVEQLEQRMLAITGAMGVIAVSSGMAAISNTLLAITGTGDNIVVSPSLFGNSFSLFESTFQPFGIEVRWVDFTKPAEVQSKIDKNTRILFFETIANPAMQVPDIKAIAAIAKEYKVPLAVDSTLTPPVIFDAKKFGVDIELLSCTKFISGGGTAIGGMIIDYGTFDWSSNPRMQKAVELYKPDKAFFFKLRREVYRNMGACMSPFNAYLHTIGMETLSLRVNQSIENTFKVAKWLSNLSKVEKVIYPGLADSEYNNLCCSQFNAKPGAVFSFLLSSKKECFQFINALQLIRRSTNLNDNKSLAIHPSSTIYTEYTDSQKMLMAVPDNLVRLSIGIEDAEDIIADIDNALNKI